MVILSSPLLDTNRVLRTAWSRIEDFPGEKSCVDFTLVLPTYNERENLPLLFERIERALEGICFEVIVVDDDSPDQTWVTARKFQKQYPWLRVIRRRKTRGVSSAVVCGFQHSCGKILGTMDANLKHDVSLLPTLLRQMTRAEFAVATRRQTDTADGKLAKARRYASGAATFLAHRIAKIPSSDPMSGFFVMRREIFEVIDNGRLSPRGCKVLVYLYARAAQYFGRKGIRLREVGYHVASRTHGKSKRTARTILDYFVMLAELRFKKPFRRRTRPRLSHAIS